MAADLRSEKVKHSLQVFGFYHKHTDAGWKNQKKNEMQQQQEPGLADSYLLPIRPYWEGRVFIETKNGTGLHKERFAFDQWAERQRLFCVACAFSGIPYWIFLMMGTAIGAKDYPLVAFLLPGEQLFELEWMAGTRKSLSYATALTLLQPLTWVPGQDRWEIPDDHPFQSIVRDNRHGHDYPHRALRGDGEAGCVHSPQPPPAPPHPEDEFPDYAQIYRAGHEAIAELQPGTGA